MADKDNEEKYREIVNRIRSVTTGESADRNTGAYYETIGRPVQSNISNLGLVLSAPFELQKQLIGNLVGTTLGQPYGGSYAQNFQYANSQVLNALIEMAVTPLPALSDIPGAGIAVRTGGEAAGVIGKTGMGVLGMASPDAATALRWALSNQQENIANAVRAIDTGSRAYAYGGSHPLYAQIPRITDAVVANAPQNVRNIFYGRGAIGQAVGAVDRLAGTASRGILLANIGTYAMRNVVSEPLRMVTAAREMGVSWGGIASAYAEAWQTGTQGLAERFGENVIKRTYADMLYGKGAEAYLNLGRRGMAPGYETSGLRFAQAGVADIDQAHTFVNLNEGFLNQWGARNPMGAYLTRLRYNSAALEEAMGITGAFRPNINEIALARGEATLPSGYEFNKQGLEQFLSNIGLSVDQNPGTMEIYNAIIERNAPIPWRKEMYPGDPAAQMFFKQMLTGLNVNELSGMAGRAKMTMFQRAFSRAHTLTPINRGTIAIMAERMGYDPSAMVYRHMFNFGQGGRINAQGLPIIGNAVPFVGVSMKSMAWQLNTLAFQNTPIAWNIEFGRELLRERPGMENRQPYQRTYTEHYLTALGLTSNEYLMNVPGMLRTDTLQTLGNIGAGGEMDAGGLAGIKGMNPVYKALMNEMFPQGFGGGSSLLGMVPGLGAGVQLLLAGKYAGKEDMRSRIRLAQHMRQAMAAGSTLIGSGMSLEQPNAEPMGNIPYGASTTGGIARGNLGIIGKGRHGFQVDRRLDELKQRMRGYGVGMTGMAFGGMMWGIPKHLANMTNNEIREYMAMRENMETQGRMPSALPDTMRWMDRPYFAEGESESMRGLGYFRSGQMDWDPMMNDPSGMPFYSSEMRESVMSLPGASRPAFPPPGREPYRSSGYGYEEAKPGRWSRDWEETRTKWSGRFGRMNERMGVNWSEDWARTRTHIREGLWGREGQLVKGEGGILETVEGGRTPGMIGRILGPAKQEIKGLFASVGGEGLEAALTVSAIEALIGMSRSPLFGGETWHFAIAKQIGGLALGLAGMGAGIKYGSQLMSLIPGLGKLGFARSIAGMALGGLGYTEGQSFGEALIMKLYPFQKYTDRGDTQLGPGTLKGRTEAQFYADVNRQPGAYDELQLYKLALMPSAPVNAASVEMYAGQFGSVEKWQQFRSWMNTPKIYNRMDVEKLNKRFTAMSGDIFNQQAATGWSNTATATLINNLHEILATQAQTPGGRAHELYLKYSKDLEEHKEGFMGRWFGWGHQQYLSDQADLETKRSEQFGIYQRTTKKSVYDLNIPHRYSTEGLHDPFQFYRDTYGIVTRYKQMPNITDQPLFKHFGIDLGVFMEADEPYHRPDVKIDDSRIGERFKGGGAISIDEIVNQVIKRMGIDMANKKLDKKVLNSAATLAAEIYDMFGTMQVAL